MERNLVLNNINIDGINFPGSEITYENAVSIPGIVNTVFRSLWFAVKVVVLSAISVTYFVILGAAAILYLVLYEKLFKTLLISLESRRPKSPYYYKWKNHHLELDYEM
jgi:hypothetical protein